MSEKDLKISLLPFQQGEVPAIDWPTNIDGLTKAFHQWSLLMAPAQKPKNLAADNNQLNCFKVARFFQMRRLAAGLELEQVSRELGLSSAAELEAYESGAKPLPLEDVFALTNIINIPPEDVIDLIQEIFGHKGHI